MVSSNERRAAPRDIAAMMSVARSQAPCGLLEDDALLDHPRGFQLIGGEHLGVVPFVVESKTRSV
jgi:hypothetical protein